MGALLLLGVLAFAVPARGAAPPADPVRAAVEKGLKRIEAGLRNYPEHRQCFSCHHQATGVFSLSAARRRGFPMDGALLEEQITFSTRTFRNKANISRGQGVGGEVTSVVYVLHTLAAVEHPQDETTTALVKYLLVRQRKDGAWPVPAFGNRPPSMGSPHTNTGLALGVLKKYAPAGEGTEFAELRSKSEESVRKGLAWLKESKPSSTEDRVFHLRGLVDGGAEAKWVEEARSALAGEQRPDGSWGQLKEMSGDAYATGTALVALRKAGLPAEHPAYQRGVKYLLGTQREDGAWVVQTRSRPLQRFFDNGDPGGKSQFISFAATGWAVLALLEGLPARKAE
jgi:N-acyl-D-amino-acid deacylase